MMQFKLNLNKNLPVNLFLFAENFPSVTGGIDHGLIFRLKGAEENIRIQARILCLKQKRSPEDRSFRRQRLQRVDQGNQIHLSRSGF